MKKIICCHIPVFVRWMQQKADPGAANAYLPAFSLGCNAREQGRDKKSRAKRENKHKPTLLS